MRRPAVLILGILVLLCGTVAKAQTQNAQTPKASSDGARGATKAQIAAKGVSIPLFFEANRGQAAAGVRFLTRGSGYTMFLAPGETVLVEEGAGAGAAAGKKKGFGASSKLSLGASKVPSTALRMELIGANRAPAMTGLEELPGKVNYLIGSDASKWQTGVPLFSRVEAKQVYPGVDLAFHGAEGALEYDFVVAAGADPSQVGFRIRGAKRIEIDRAGDLVLQTAKSEFRMHRPLIYQEIGGARRMVDGGFVLSAKKEVRFRVGEYDRNQPVVIDPSIGFASFLGGLQEDQILDVVVDDSTSAAPKIYVAGFSTDITSFPETSNPVVGFAGGGEYGFVAKINPRSTLAASLSYLTFIGGHTPFAAQNSCGSAISNVRLDASQGAANAQPVLGGITGCSDYPATKTISSNGITGGIATVVTRLNAAGNAVDVSAMLGGNGQQDGGFPALDASGNVMVSGGTKSTDLPTTALAYMKNFNNGQAGTATTSDCFVALLRRSDFAPTYLTYLNVGVGSSQGSGVGCGGFLDTSGRILAGGNTFSGMDFNVGVGGANLANGFQTAFKGTENTFVMELDPTKAGTAALIYATYYGGGGATDATNGAVAISADIVAIGGDTTSNGTVGDIPRAQPLPNQNTNQAANGGETGFVFIVDTSKTGAASLVFSSYLGGSSGGDEVHAIGLDVNDPLDYHLIVGGETTSGDFPTSNPFQAALVGAQDGFVSAISVNPSSSVPSSFLFSSFIGGGAGGPGETEQISGLAVGADSTIYAVGRSASADFYGHTNPTTAVLGFQGSCSSCTISQNQPTAFDDGVIFSLQAASGATVTKIVVNPQTVSVAAGNTQQFQATGFFSDGSLGDITSQVTWSSDNTSFATVNSAGLATAVSAGTAHINATLGNATTNPATMNVTGGPAATHLSVTAQSSVTAGTPFNVTVTALDASNAIVTGYGGTVTFTSSDANAVLPANSTLTNGTKTFSVTLNTAGSKTVTATDTVTPSISGVLTITVTGVGPTSMLAISKTHMGNFTQGQHSAQYTVTVSNAPNGAPTSGTVTVTDTALSALAQDFAASFSGSSNPNGVWSYGQFVESTSAFTLLPDQNAGFPTCGLPYWSGTGYPDVIANNSGSTVSCGTVTVPNDMLWMHPTNTEGTDSDVRFTASASGTYEITGSFSALDSTSTLDSILVNGTPVFSTFICNPGNGNTCATTNTRAPFSVVQTLSVGSTVDFIVNCCSGPNQTFLFDSTGLSGAIDANLSGLSLVSMFGTGWTCGAPNPANTCTRTDALAPGAPYPPITVLVNVGVNASSPQVNTVSVSGGGSATANASDSTVITPAPSAQLTITKTHAGNFTQGQQGAQYSLTVANAPGAGPTSGTQAQSSTVQSTGSIYDTGGGSTPPTMITLPSGATSVAFNSVTGSITTGCASTEGCIVLNNGTGNNANDPDGVGAAPATSSNTGTSTISGITGPGAGYLVGVFVPAGGPAGTAPTALDFTSSGLGTSFTSLSPQLDQVFFIGDGLTGNGTGTQQTFNIPTGAGQLWLGISDAGFYNGAPGAYNDNLGFYTVNFTVNAPSSGGVTVTETAPTGLTLVSMAGTGWTCGTPNPANVCTRSNALAAGTSYPVITVIVNVAANATSPQVNTAAVTGGGSAPANASDSTVIVSASTAATHFSVSAPATATVGTAINFTVTALTAANTTAANYTGTVHFTSTDGAAALPANSTLTNGVGTFSATLNTVGSKTITATDTVTASITGTSGAISVSAVATPLLTVTTAGTGTGTVAGSGINCKSGSNNGCTASITAGTQVTLMATADAGSAFTNWNAVCPSLTSATCTFTMPATATGIMATFTKNPATLQSIAVTPANPTEPINSTVQFHATGTFSDQSTKDITATVTWASSNTDAATIVPGGLATTGGNADLSTTISASLDDVTGSTLLTLTNSPITISVTPPPGGTIPPVPPGGKLAVGIVLTATPGFSGTVTFGCTVTGADGQPAPSITCIPDPANVTITPGGPSQVAIVVNTFCTGDAAPLSTPNPGGFGGGLGLLLFGLTLGGAALTIKRRSPQWALSFAVLTLIAIGGSACSSLPKGPNGATPPGNYTLTITATVNGTTSTAPPINFTVQ